MSIFDELKRRKVFRVAATYGVVAWILMQIGEVTFPALNIPEWVMSALVVVLLAGFPIAIIFAWIFDKTPQGFIKTDVNTAEEVGGMNIKVDNRPFYLQKRNLFLALGVIAGILIGTYGGSAITSKIDSKSIAVLPFDNYSTAPEDQYFSDGITEVIIAHLAKIKDFTVISRTSVMGYKGTTKSLKDIGKELGVAHILEGSVQRVGDEVRIVSQLIEAKSDKHLWAETYDETMNSLFAVQSDIAKKIALAMETEISGDVERRIDERPTENIAAWDDYLKGIEFDIKSNSREDIEKSQFYYDKAFEKDPNFAAALARSAGKDLSLYWLGYDHIQSRIITAKEKIDKATIINSKSPEVLSATGYYYYYAYRDYPSALKYFDQAQKLEPGKSSHISDIGFILRRQGKIDESLANFHKALQINPNNGSLAMQIRGTYHKRRDYKKADQMIDKALLLVSDNDGLHSLKVWSNYYMHQNISKLTNDFYDLRKRYGKSNLLSNHIITSLLMDRKFDDAIVELDNIEDIFKINQYNYIPYDFIRARTFDLMNVLDIPHQKKVNSLYESSVKQLEQKLLKNPRDIRISSGLALIYSYLGRKDDAITMIESAMSEVPIEKYPIAFGPHFAKEIEVNLVVGNNDKALEMLEFSSSIYGGIGYFDLMHPKWDTIRNTSQFKLLLKQLRPQS